jgi:DNA invertase Pin-like site-specific DNA recombinase
MSNAVPMTGTSVDIILQAVNTFLLELAKEQIRLAFEQSAKEVADLHQRTKEGMETARLNGKQIGQVKGSKLHIKKSDPAKEIIRKHSRTFGGTLSDADCQKLAGVSRNTYYKYKKALKESGIA